MAHSVVYPRNLNDLIQKWAEQKVKDTEAKTQTYVANGQCARLPQALTTVGHTSRWQPGERVVDAARTIKPGTVIANFVSKDGKMVYPNAHGYHAAIFVGAEGFSVVTGKPTKIIVFDQWIGATPDKSHTPGIRGIRAWSEEAMRARGMKFSPCDNANDFFVVMVP